MTAGACLAAPPSDASPAELAQHIYLCPDEGTAEQRRAWAVEHLAAAVVAGNVDRVSAVVLVGLCSAAAGLPQRPSERLVLEAIAGRAEATT